MARDTRQWQDSLAVSPHFEGDQAVCVQWVGVAKGKLSQLLRSNPGPTSLTFSPEQGVEIYVSTRPNNIRIRAGVEVYVTYADKNSAIGGGSYESPPYQDKVNRFIHKTRSKDHAQSFPYFYAGKHYWVSKTGECLSWDKSAFYVGGKYSVIALTSGTSILCAAKKERRIIAIIIKNGELYLRIYSTSFVASGHTFTTAQVSERLINTPDVGFSSPEGRFLTDAKTFVVLIFADATAPSNEGTSVYKYVFSGDYTSEAESKEYTNPYIYSNEVKTTVVDNPIGPGGWVFTVHDIFSLSSGSGYQPCNLIINGDEVVLALSNVNSYSSENFDQWEQSTGGGGIHASTTTFNNSQDFKFKRLSNSSWEEIFSTVSTERTFSTSGTGEFISDPNSSSSSGSASLAQALYRVYFVSKRYDLLVYIRHTSMESTAAIWDGAGSAGTMVKTGTDTYTLCARHRGIEHIIETMSVDTGFSGDSPVDVFQFVDIDNPPTEGPSHTATSTHTTYQLFKLQMGDFAFDGKLLIFCLTMDGQRTVIIDTSVKTDLSYRVINDRVDVSIDPATEIYPLSVTKLSYA